MPTTVIKKMGATNTPTTMDYSTLQAWEDASPTDLTTLRSNTTITGATSSTIILDASASGTNSFYVGHPVWCDARPTEKRLITAYNGTTKIATISTLNGSNATWDNTPLIEAYTIDSCIWQVQCYNQGEITGAAPLLTFAGETTSSICYLELTTATGASFHDHATAATNPLKYDATKGIGIRATSGYAVYTITSSSVNFIRISNLQIKTPINVGGISFGSASSINHTVDNVIAECYGNYVNIGPNRSKIRNCIAIQTDVSTADCISNRLGAAGWEVDSCTIVLCSNRTPGGVAIRTDYGTLTVKNCAIFGKTTIGGTGSSASYAGSNNATDLSAIGFGSANQVSLTYTGQFVGTTSSAPDFRAVATGSLKNGTPDLTNTPNDIIGTVRDATTPYIGCWEVAANSKYSYWAWDTFGRCNV